MLTQYSDSKAVMHMKHLRHRLPRNNDRQGTHGRNKEVQNTKQEVNNGKQDMYYCIVATPFVGGGDSGINERSRVAVQRVLL